MKIRHEASPNQTGLLLIEIILAVAIFGLMSLIILSAFIYGRGASAEAGDNYQAAEIANVVVEAVNNIAQSSFSGLSTYTQGTTYYLSTSSNQWSLSPTPTTMDTIFTPALVFSNGPNNSIEVKVTVSWTENAQRNAQLSATTYLTNWTAAT